MKQAQRPAGGWPWEAPGYTFAIGWPVGYVPTLGDEMAVDRSGAIASARATQSRRIAMETGIGLSCGTIAPLSARSDPTRIATGKRPPMRRETARKLGLARYFTGIACPHGHVDDRFTSCGACVVCTSERNAAAVRARAEKRVERPRKQRELTAATFEGQPCKRGHDGLRYRSSHHCVYCQREKKAAWLVPEVAA